MREYIKTKDGFMELNSRQIAYIKGKLMFFKFTFLTNMKRSDLTETVKKPLYNKWQDLMAA